MEEYKKQYLFKPLNPFSMGFFKYRKKLNAELCLIN